MIIIIPREWTAPFCLEQLLLAQNSNRNKWARWCLSLRWCLRNLSKVCRLL